MNGSFLNVPVELCKYALTNHKVNQVKLYVYLKTICSGHFKVNKNLIAIVCKELKLKSGKTFKSNLNWLLEENWITVNSKSKSYRIIGFRQLAKKLEFNSATGALFDPPEFEKFRAFLIGAVISYHSKWKRRKAWQSGLLEGSPRKSCKPPSDPSDFACLYLAKILNVSKTTASKYKVIAEKAGYIKIEKCFSQIDVPISQLPLLKKYSDKSIEKIRSINGKVCLQEADKIYPSIHLRRKSNIKCCRKKSEPIKKGG
jgi:hypothetical protein